MRFWVLAVAIAVAATSCTGSSETRITLEDLIDPAVELPVPLDEIDGIDLAEITPADDIGFCDAFASAPSRWLTDAVVPLQFWHDSFDGVTDAPMAAEAHVAALLAFADQRLAWNFGRAERPEFTPELQQAAKLLADVAVAHCDDLPLILGRSPDYLASPPWFRGPDELSESEIASHCEEDRERVARGIAAFVDRYGEQPRHLEQLEAGLYGDLDVFFFSLELYGIGDSADGAVPVPVPNGPCVGR